MGDLSAYLFGSLQLASETAAMGRTTTYGHDGDQELIAVSQVDPCTTGTRTTTPADPTCTTLNVSVGRQATYAYDGAGNKVSQTVSPVTGGTAGAGATTGYTYDAAGRLARELIDSTPSGTTTSGYVNRAVSFAYDADNRVASQTVGSAATGGTSVTSYTYDAQGDRLRQSVTDGSSALTTTWTYGQNGQPLTMVTPDGNALGGTPANYTTQYGYDNSGDLATVTSPPTLVESYANQAGSTAQSVTTYAYDGDGNLVSVTDPRGNTASARAPWRAAPRRAAWRSRAVPLRSARSRALASRAARRQVLAADPARLRVVRPPGRPARFRAPRPSRLPRARRPSGRARPRA